MVASKQARSIPPERRWGGQAEAASAVHDGSVAALVEQADAARLRAPELALVLGERAAVLAETADDHELWLHAESLVVHAKIRFGHRTAIVGRAVTALRAAEDTAQPALAAQLRTDLAICARSAGVPLAGLAAIRPVLMRSDVAPVRRATALAHAVGCTASLGRRAELERVLMEADRLCRVEERSSGADVVSRTSVTVAAAAHYRRHGDNAAAVESARAGLRRLDQLDDFDADGGAVRIRLSLQLVLALLDAGDTAAAMDIAHPVLARPCRAACVAPAGWLHLAVATRVHLPRGEAESAARVLRGALHDVDRHGLPALTARLWLELANIEERYGDPHAAVRCLQDARAAEHVHARARRQASGLLMKEFGNGMREPVNFHDWLTGTNEQDSHAAHGQPSPESDVAPAGASASDSSLARTARTAPPPGKHAGPEPSGPEPENTAMVEDASRASGPGYSWASEGVADRHDRSTAGSRHSVDEEPAAAESVLGRLGIDAASGGGRRRASEPVRDLTSDPRDENQAEPPGSPPAEPSGTPSGTSAESSGTPPTATTGGPATAGQPPDDTAVTSRDSTTGDAEQSAHQLHGGTSEEWLPRLKLPPSLAPFEDLDPVRDTTAPPESDADPQQDAPVNSGREGEPIPGPEPNAEGTGVPAEQAPNTTQRAAAADVTGGDPLGEIGGDVGTVGDASGATSPDPRREPGGAAASRADARQAGSGDQRAGGNHAASDDARNDAGVGARHEPGGGTTPAGDDASALDEPPADAGLAELLTRALAEHRAGMTSASSLVERLGGDHTPSNRPRSINGQYRDDTSGSGRHRNDG